MAGLTLEDGLVWCCLGERERAVLNVVPESPAGPFTESENPVSNPHSTLYLAHLELHGGAVDSLPDEL